MKLNLGCGTGKLEGFVNVDVDESLSPDMSFDLTKPFPFDDNSVEEVVMFHTIEHIQKRFHQFIFLEIHRVLKPDGLAMFSFPEFWECATRWHNNHHGAREFWEATIYGRQASISDFHVALMARDMFKLELENNGFDVFYCGPEPGEDFNSLVKARKTVLRSYEEDIARLYCGMSK
jgi:SAM-dependent methyltransferase